jgi:RNA polymerase sigma-70 factor (ECF subfamily)
METQITTQEFEVIYKQYTPRLKGLAKKFLYRDSLAEECVQDVFRKLLKQDFDKIREEDHLRAWLFTVCRNGALNIKRKESRFVEEKEDESLSEEPNPFENLDKKECYKKAIALMKGVLSKDQQKVIKLRYFSDLSYKEIAKKMKTTTGNVGFLLSIGLSKVRKKLMKSI